METMKEFVLYIEGSEHSTYFTEKAARKAQKKFEAEGWNVRLMVWTKTILGPMGVHI